MNPSEVCCATLLNSQGQRQADAGAAMSDFLEKGRERYEQGDKAQILYCLEYCISNNLFPPAWLNQAFSDAYLEGRLYKVKSWDDVFGRPLPKGKHLKTARRNMEIAWDLFWRVRELHDAGAPIDKRLFEKVGDEYDVSGTVASEL
jgi:hypothetical protein